MLTRCTLEYQEYETGAKAGSWYKPGRNLLAAHAFQNGKQQLSNLANVDPLPGMPQSEQIDFSDLGQVGWAGVPTTKHCWVKTIPRVPWTHRGAGQRSIRPRGPVDRPDTDPP